jgi:phage tail-like protein
MTAEQSSVRNSNDDPYLSFRFRVEIDSLQVSGFNEVQGLSFETQVEKFREGGVNSHERQLSGPAIFPSNLILKRGLANSDMLWSWYCDVMEGRVERKPLTVVLMNSGGEEQWRWVFRDACPVKWIGPQLAANQAAVAFESIEIVHGGMEPGTQSGLRR